MDIHELHISDPMADIDSARARELGERYDDFATHCSSATECHHTSLPRAS